MTRAPLPDLPNLAPYAQVAQRLRFVVNLHEQMGRTAALIRHVRAGDHVVVASMDRLARSVIDLHGIVE